jgi:thiosulfate/3-mercaptopyruvate sulfurtransferase
VFTTLIDADAVARNLGRADWAIFDCRFALDDVERGGRDYLAGHIPGARYVDLDRDLTAAVVPGHTGRHPLPDVGRLSERLSAWGVDGNTQVVVYDDASGAYGVRLWWLLNWLGHDGVAVLDGGWAAWVASGHPTRAGHEDARPARTFIPHVRPELVADAAEVAAAAADPTRRVLDARAAERFRGEAETIDPVAGHIPGARSAPYADSLRPDGRFRPAAEIRAHFAALLDGVEAGRAIVYCGSGVTAAHHVLAMRHAGLGEARLYAGSWSEWITDPRRPVATGPG